MRRFLAVLLLGALLPMLQSALADFVAPRYAPDLSLLFVFALGLCWRGLFSGTLLAALLGYVADLLSGSLLGQHALLRMATFAAARFASHQLNLRGPVPQALFVAALSVANAFALAGLTAFFAPDVETALPSGIVVHAGVNACVAPIAARVLERLVSRLDEDDAGRRVLRLEPRSFRA